MANKGMFRSVTACTLALFGSNLILAIAFLGASSAKAALITFDASGNFADGATLSGTLTINTTTGAATAVDLIVSAPDSLTFDFIQFQGIAGPVYEIQTGTTATGNPNFDLGLALTTLVGYSGGPIESVATGMSSDLRYNSSDVVAFEHGPANPGTRAFRLRSALNRNGSRRPQLGEGLST